MSQREDAAAGKPRVWSLELVIVIALPTIAVVAGIITMVIATRSGFEPHTQVKTDRFAQEQTVDERP